MSIDRKSLLLYAVTDDMWLNGRTLPNCVEEAILGGATFIQLREKNTSYDEFLSLAKDVKKVTDKYKIPFVINDNIDIAIECGADGIHVGQSDMQAGDVRKRLGNDKIIGVSAHNLEEAILAEQSGADYLGVGAVFSTSTKLDANNVSMDILKKICDTVSIPAIAIGGIGLENIASLKGSGVAGVAVVSAIFANDDIKSAANNLHTLCSHTFK